MHNPRATFARLASVATFAWPKLKALLSEVRPEANISRIFMARRVPDPASE
jgi:hypothetical protein